jgi:hypothetical protein
MKNQIRLVAERGLVREPFRLLSIPTITKGGGLMSCAAPVGLGKNLILSLIFLLTLTSQGFSSQSSQGKGEGIYSDYSNDQIVEAIGKAENSVKYPYGIKSIDTKGNEEYARKICFNSVRNNRKRWIEAGKPEDLISFISRRYCPINAPDDPTGLNKNWISNVKYNLKKGRS